MSCTKERLLAVERIITDRGDVTIQEILDDLERKYDIKAERKSIYDDIAALTFFMPIEMYGSGRNFRYRLRKDVHT